MRKTAIVTGCTSGIGKEISLELARDGYDIIGTYNSNKRETLTLKEKINNIGVKFDCYKLDLTSDDSINDFITTMKNNYVNIEVLVNNAGLSLDNDFDLKTKKEFIKVLQVNLIGPFLLVQGLKDLLDIVINISSTDGINTYTKYNIDYSASKAGLINLTKSFALILQDKRIYAICPNWVNTESIQKMNQDYLKEEMNRIGQSKLIEPKDIANKVIDLIYGNEKSGSIIVMEGAHVL